MSNQKTVAEIPWTFKNFVYFQSGKLNVVAQVITFFKEKSKPVQNNFIYKNCIIFQQQ